MTVLRRARRPYADAPLPIFLSGRGVVHSIISTSTEAGWGASWGTVSRVRLCPDSCHLIEIAS